MDGRFILVRVEGLYVECKTVKIAKNAPRTLSLSSMMPYLLCRLRFGVSPTKLPAENGVLSSQG